MKERLGVGDNRGSVESCRVVSVFHSHRIRLGLPAVAFLACVVCGPECGAERTCSLYTCLFVCRRSSSFYWTTPTDTRSSVSQVLFLYIYIYTYRVYRTNSGRGRWRDQFFSSKKRFRTHCPCDVVCAVRVAQVHITRRRPVRHVRPSRAHRIPLPISVSFAVVVSVHFGRVRLHRNIFVSLDARSSFFPCDLDLVVQQKASLFYGRHATPRIRSVVCTTDELKPRRL